MPLYKGNTKIGAIYKGTTKISELRKGNTLVFSAGLPNGYTRCEYIESTGTQYIDSGCLVNDNTRLVIDYYKPTQGNTNSQWIFGTRIASNDNAFGINYYTNQNPSYKFINTDVYVSQTFIDNRALCDFDIKNRTFIFTQLTTSTFSLTSDSINNPYNIYLFARNEVGSVQGFSSIKFYSCKIYDNSVLVRNFIPCLDANGVPCLYDTVTKQPYYNQGTGTFNYKIKLPSGYQQVKYIESTGTQYIDTGYIPNQDTKVVANFSGQAAQTLILFGGADSFNSNAYECYLYLQSGTIKYTSNYGNQNVTTDGLYSTSYQAINIVKDKNNTTFDVGGTTYNVNATYSTFVAGRSLNIFRLNRSTPYMFSSYVRFYSMNIYDNSTLIRCFVPCYRTSDSVIGLYDALNNKFYTNAGTGSFTKGSDV